jgi:hypothetical protein
MKNDAIITKLQEELINLVSEQDFNDQLIQDQSTSIFTTICTKGGYEVGTYFADSLAHTVYMILQQRGYDLTMEDIEDILYANIA